MSSLMFEQKKKIFYFFTHVRTKEKYAISQLTILAINDIFCNFFWMDKKNEKEKLTTSESIHDVKLELPVQDYRVSIRTFTLFQFLLHTLELFNQNFVKQYSLLSLSNIICVVENLQAVNTFRVQPTRCITWFSPFLTHGLLHYTIDDAIDRKIFPRQNCRCFIHVH